MSRDDGLIRTPDGDLVPDRPPAAFREARRVAPTRGCPRCRDGWLGDADDDQQVPCPTCRPHLAERHRERPGGGAPPPPELRALIAATRRQRLEQPHRPAVTTTEEDA